MEQQSRSIPKTLKYTLKPTLEQERELDRTLLLCCQVYNAAIGVRREAWRMRGVTVTYFQQKAELPEIKNAMPEYAEVNAQVLQNVVPRVDRRFRRTFSASATAPHPAIPASMAEIATTASPPHRSGTTVAPDWILAF